MNDQNKKQINRTLTPEVRILDAKAGTAEFIASDQTLDHYREVILAKGWKFDYFRKNSPFVDSHDYSTIEKMLGRVESFRIEGNALIEVVRYAIDEPACKLAALAFGLVEKGYLKAVSVGFIPTSAAYRWADQKDWNDAVKEAGLDAETAANCNGIFLEQQQIELSQCIIGANPNAIARAYADKALNEEQIAQLGFGDTESFDFLQTASRAWDKADEVAKSIIRLEMRRCYQFAKGPTLKSDSPARSRADAAESQQREQEEFLGKLRALTR